MLLIMVYFLYHDVFVGGVVFFNQVGQPSEFAAGQHLFVSFINKLLNKFFRVTAVFLEC